LTPDDGFLSVHDGARSLPVRKSKRKQKADAAKVVSPLFQNFHQPEADDVIKRNGAAAEQWRGAVLS